MKLICTQENFKKAIYKTERVVSKQNTLPILNNILFETENGLFKISATNLEIGVAVKIGAKIEKEGRITIPAKLISNFINNLPTGDSIDLEVVEQSLKVKNNSSKAVIKGLSASEFPLLPKKSADFQIKIPNFQLKTMISKVLTAVALNEMRQELTGINLNLTENSMFFASTDSFRLAEVGFDVEKNVLNRELYELLVNRGGNIIIPATTLSEILRIISIEETGETKISIEEGQIFFEMNGTSLVSRLINGKYPEYKHIMPSEYKTRIVGEKSLIQGAVKMANVFSPGKTSEIGLKIIADEKKVLVEGRSIEVGENMSELNFDVTGPSQEVVLNARYLLDGINSIDGSKIAILVNSGTTPIAIKEVDEKTGKILEDYTYIVMPIKS